MSYRTGNCISIALRTKNPKELVLISTFILFKRTLLQILSLVGCSTMFWGKQFLMLQRNVVPSSSMSSRPSSVKKRLWTA
jgi:hypothetical protein